MVKGSVALRYGISKCISSRTFVSDVPVQKRSSLKALKYSCACRYGGDVMIASVCGWFCRFAVAESVSAKAMVWQGLFASVCASDRRREAFSSAFFVIKFFICSCQFSRFRNSCISCVLCLERQSFAVLGSAQENLRLALIRAGRIMHTQGSFAF